MSKEKPMSLRPTPEQLLLIRRQASQEELSAADVVRRALDNGLPWGPRQPLEEQMDTLREAFFRESLALTERIRLVQQVIKRLKDAKEDVHAGPVDLAITIRRAEWMLDQIEAEKKRSKEALDLVLGLGNLTRAHLTLLRHHAHHMSWSATTTEIRKGCKELASFLEKYVGL